MAYFNSFKLINSIIRNSIKDLDHVEFRKILYKSLTLTLVLTILCCYLLYVFLDAYVFTLFDFKFESEFINTFLNSLFVKTIFMMTKIILLWMIFSIILIPVGNLISFLFEEKIFDLVNEINLYNFQSEKLKNTFLNSFLLSFKLLLFAIFINLLLLPFYIFVPLANILLFIFVNGYLIGREFYSNILFQFYNKREVENLRLESRTEELVLGSFIFALYTVPILNLFIPFFATSCFSHLFLIKKKTL